MVSTFQHSILIPPHSTRDKNKELNWIMGRNKDSNIEHYPPLFLNFTFPFFLKKKKKIMRFIY
jgi:hypothetical protein